MHVWFLIATNIFVFLGKRGGITEDKENFVLFLQELKERLVKRNKILTAAIPAAKLAIDVGYDIEEICEYIPNDNF